MNTSNQGNMNHQQGMNPYVKFTLMILTSTIVMFIMIYFNTYQLDHVYRPPHDRWSPLDTFYRDFQVTFGL